MYELDHESLTIVPNKLGTSQNSQSNESSCSEQWELIPDCGHGDSESTSGEQWELIPDDGRSDSERTSGEHLELIPGYDHSGSESTSGEHWELIPDHGHSDSERSSGESWEVLADCHSDEDDYVCVESSCGDPWQMLQEPLQGPRTQPKQGIGNRISRGSDACHVPSMEGLEAGRFCACQSNVIPNLCRADSGSCVHGGATVAHSLHLNIGQNTNSGVDQTIGGVNYEQGYARLAINSNGDVVIKGPIYLNVPSQASETNLDNQYVEEDDDIIQESEGSTKRSKTNEDGDYVIPTNPDTPTSVPKSSTISRPQGRDAAKKKRGKQKVTKSSHNSEFTEEYRAMRIVREKELELSERQIQEMTRFNKERAEAEKQKSYAALLNTLLAKTHLTPAQEAMIEDLTEKVMGKTF